MSRTCCRVLAIAALVFVAGACSSDDNAPETRTIGLEPNIAFLGPDSSVTREAITLTIDGDSAILDFDVAATTALEYNDDGPFCFADFTYASAASNLVVDGANVSGTTELIRSYDGDITCPNTRQVGIGVPQTVDVSGMIDGDFFVGQFSVDGIANNFTASVESTPES